MNKLAYLFRHTAPCLWLLIASLFTIGNLHYSCNCFHDFSIHKFIGNDGGDSSSYILPVENLLQSGAYQPDFRMPGYAFFYYPLRLIFSTDVAKNLLLFAQLLAHVLSVYVFALTGFKVFRRPAGFYVAYFFYLFTFANTEYILALQTESLSISFTIYFTYALIMAFESGRYLHYLTAGVAYFILTALRPMYSPYILIPFMYLVPLALHKNISLRQAFISILIFTLPIMAFEAYWLPRNYDIHKAIHPFHNGFLYPGTELTPQRHVFDFVKAFGGNTTRYEPTAEIRWFNIRESREGQSKPLKDKNVMLPSFVTTPDYGMDSLAELAAMMDLYQRPGISAQEKEQLRSKIIERADRYTASFIQHKPFHYFIWAPVLLIKKFYIHSYPVFNLGFGELNIVQKTIKILLTMVYLVIIVTGNLAAACCLFKRRNGELTGILSFVVFFTLMFYPVITRFIEYRYAAQAYPATILMSFYALYWFYLLVAGNLNESSSSS